jgi:hypothetical protein
VLVQFEAKASGVHAVPLKEGGEYRVSASQNAFNFKARFSRELMTTIAVGDIVALEVGGSGVTNFDGGFRGGGFGTSPGAAAEAAAEGMLAATVLNALTTRRRVDCWLRFQTAGGEATMVVSDLDPRTLRARLTSVLRTLDARRKTPGTAAGALDVVDRLAELSRMLEAGHLSRDEFDVLKQRLLAQ